MHVEVDDFVERMDWMNGRRMGGRLDIAKLIGFSFLAVMAIGLPLLNVSLGFQRARQS